VYNVGRLPSIKNREGNLVGVEDRDRIAIDYMNDDADQPPVITTRILVHEPSQSLQQFPRIWKTIDREGDRLGCRWPVSQRTMRTYSVAVSPPLLDQHTSLPQRVERLPVQQLVLQHPVERLDVSILPRTARLDEQCSHADSPEPLTNRPGAELRPVVGPVVCRDAPADEQIRHGVQNIVRVDPPALFDGQALPRVLVNYRQHPEHPAFSACQPPPRIGLESINTSRTDLREGRSKEDLENFIK